MDRESIQRLKNVLTALKQMGKTILVSEHRLYYLRELADRYVLVDDGKIKDIYDAATLLGKTLDQLHNLGLRSLHDTNIELGTSGCDNGTPALEVKNIYVARGQTEIIRGASMEVGRGEIVGIVGQMA